MLSSVAILFAIEFLDEIVFGLREAAWPSIRTDLGLGYAAIGVLLTVPSVAADLLEPFLALLGDTGRRHGIIAWGGLGFSLSLLVIAAAPSFGVLLVGFLLLYPASGAFVSLSQAALMDMEPAARERNMARWVLAGSVGVVAGPILFSVSADQGGGWRLPMGALAVLSLLLLVRLVLSRRPAMVEPRSFREGLVALRHASGDREVVRWLVLTHVADLMGDVLTGFLAVYFVDAAGASVAVAAIAVLIWTVAALAGDALMVVILRRVSGLAYLRVSAPVSLALFSGLLLAPGVAAKLPPLAMLGLVRAGWYAVSQGRLYDQLGGSSGTALALSNVTGLVSGLAPLVIGLAAERVGISGALWLCLLAPVALIIGLRHDHAAPAA